VRISLTDFFAVGLLLSWRRLFFCGAVSFESATRRLLRDAGTASCFAKSKQWFLTENYRDSNKHSHVLLAASLASR